MLGDVLLIQDKHREAAAKISERILCQRAPKYLIAVSGESGSGKSELAHCIAKELKTKKISAKIIHTDNYYRIHPLQRTEWRKQHGIESIGYSEYDWETLNRNIKDFKNGNISEMPCIDIVTDQVDKLSTDFSEIELLILDGLYAIKAEGIHIRIFIELTYHETKKAQIARGKEPQNEYRMQVLEREHVVVQSLRPLANVIINKEYVVS
ncbi:MAG: zeta toxin family protein [Bacteroidia bacterium]|nr:zeta toxin family protein [Bacteroidia bacterium]